MSQLLYAASCNPPRRAKRPRPSDPASPSQSHHAESLATSPAGALQPRPILPKRTPSSARSVASSDSGSVTPQLEPEPSEPVPARPPNKRGRKPGPLSRSAREAQRRLNHSIIEKARRTKINNALATLKELVPLDYGRKINSDDEEDGDEDDEDGEYGIEKKKPKPKPGKKEEKEREYKLEILVRTVAYMQDLLQRVAVLEQANPLCSKCGGSLHTESRATVAAPPPAIPERYDSAPEPEPSPPFKRARTGRYDRESLEPSQGVSLPSVLHETALASASDNPSTGNRLPSISSWLPDTLLEFKVSSPSRIDHTRNNGDHVPPLQLPTPPSSTQFQPVVASAGSTSALPSSANNARRKASSSPLLIRTPEDEHAATMLLQISGSGSGTASSPTFRPLPPSIVSPTEPLHHMLSSLSSSSSSSSNGDGKKMQFKGSAGRDDSVSIAVQTPSSLLGLITVPTD